MSPANELQIALAPGGPRRTSRIGAGLLAAAALLTMILPASRAGLIAAIPQGSPANNNVVNFTVGWTFTVTQTVQVDALGYFDHNANGLASAHAVAIWDSTGANQLVSATVPNGVAGTLDNSFRFVPCTLTTLLPGNYVIGGHSGSGDLVADQATSVLTIPQITFGQNRATTTSSGTLMFPNTHFPSQGLGFFGPNFQVLPEPGFLTLLPAAGALLLRRRRPRK
jgi:hypothetical protein